MAVSGIKLKDNFYKFRNKSDEKDAPEEKSKDVGVLIEVHPFTRSQKHSTS